MSEFEERVESMNHLTEQQIAEIDAEVDSQMGAMMGEMLEAELNERGDIIVEEQPVQNSFVWWLGMIAIALYNFLLGAAYTGILDPLWCVVIAGTLSAIMTYCNINNPSIKKKLTV